ncbi:archaeosortase C, PEF-CTERM variant [Candidatus Methanoperedens nitroreducens]|uniref:Archaeosortase C, PEF-CTERM variant n=1 Tax=Candidatus Methanoperedens nitratireducens TaxID=1392998 RepID=A0A062UVV2_9EURY|nr:archaeosortase C [Candidatus Methanoperedens nitroreducens]KCZ71156.1 archaeosortase C, PEF-CTERM variant [Candidatus Methanoperedens nitroreducens]MDJ1421466.1 archaeosortase C [Candidatus Methanoperedens sp.]
MATIDDQRHNVLIFLLVMAFFTGATIQLSEGSVLIGVVLFLIALALTTKIRLSSIYITKSSKFFIVLGTFIVLADLVYNLKAMNNLGTLDSMTFFMGGSLIAYGISQYRRMGEFGIYTSGTFIILYLFFYSLLPSLNNNFINYFDHYLVLLPSLAIVNAVSDMSLHVVATETVHFKGFEDSTVVIGGPCSGIYSMILLTGLIVGYTKMERLTDKRRISLLIVITVLVAYIANLIRVSVLYYIGYYYGIERMMFVHVYLGWIIFMIIFLGIMMVLYKTK